MERPTWVSILPVVVSFLSGGFAGSIFTWYVNRATPTVLTYAITTTTAGTDPQVKSLIPNLKLRIDDEEISVVHTHTIDFSTRSGPYVNSAETAVTFPLGLRIYGTALETPSPLHHISCPQIPNGFRCTMSPISTGIPNKYRLIIATNQKEQPNMVTVTNGLLLEKLEEYLTSKKSISILDLSLILLILSVIITLIAALYYDGYIIIRERENLSTKLEQKSRKKLEEN